MKQGLLKNSNSLSLELVEEVVSCPSADYFSWKQCTHQVEAFKRSLPNLRVAPESWKGGGCDIQFRGVLRRILNTGKGKHLGHLLETIRARLREARVAVNKILIPNLLNSS